MQTDEETGKVLESIGLNKNEILIYLDLIRCGKSSANDVSKNTGIHRSNTYDTMEKLVDKGIVKQIVENGKKIFYPIEPKNLLNYIKQKESELLKIIPKIEEMQNKKQELRRVTVSEGLNSVKTILLRQLDFKKPISIYGTPKEIVEILGGFVNEFQKERIKRKIYLRHIYGSDAIKRVREVNKLPYTEARYFPSSYNSKTSTAICENQVILILWDAPASAIVIENKAVADTYQNYFEILWEEAMTIL